MTYVGVSSWESQLLPPLLLLQGERGRGYFWLNTCVEKFRIKPLRVHFSRWLYLPLNLIPCTTKMSELTLITNKTLLN